MQYYTQEVDEVLKEVQSSKEGLTSEEAKKRIEKNGKNKLDEGKRDGLLKKIIKSLADPMIIMLLVTAGISAGVAAAQNDSFTDVFIILFVVVINTIMGLVQESKAEKAIDSLKEMTAAMSKVKRDGKVISIKSEDLTIGDIVVLEAGDMVPADCRVIESHSLKIDESAITGESVAVNKMIDILHLQKGQSKISLGDRKNMVYSGTTVAYGRGEVVVVDIGMNTEIGKIAASLQEVQNEQTPLQRKMAELSAVLTKIVLGICILVFIVSLVRHGAFTTQVFVNTLLSAIALAVAAIPEGLPAVVTIILSIGVTAMSKRNALIRKLNAVETLGCIQVICTDKTGTLTQNKMTVVEENSNNNALLAKGMALCSDSKMGAKDTQATGEPTENGLVEYAYKNGFKKYDIDKKWPRIGEVPFDSMRKLMSVLVDEEGTPVQYTKGACEILLSRCSKYLAKDGEIVDMTDNIKKEIVKANKQAADNALRVLGLAYKKYKKRPDEITEKDEADLTFVGFVGMIDPCRDEVYGAIEETRKAGIRPIMITGDHKDTAVAIAKNLGIIEDASQAMTGAELEEISDSELTKVVKKVSVYARVQPEHKTRIVKALKKLNYIVAMTGDGVNDAPSIKAADVGLSMGITGTDVTKGASDVVLADDNYATIVNAVEEGRKIYDNVRKVLQFQLSTNMAEVIAVFIASLGGFEILSPAHLLWVNMITDSAPGLTLGVEKAEGDIMSRKPRPTNDSVFSDGAGIDMVWQGMIMAILVILSYKIGVSMDGAANGMSMAFLTMNFLEMFHAVSMRSQKKSLFQLKTFNWWMFLACCGISAITISVLYIPFFVKLFGFASISQQELGIAIGLAVAILPLIEIGKLIRRWLDKNK